MSNDRWRWAQKAQELRFHQLEAARRQAESWRTGLTGLTALFGVVLVVKGRDTVTDLSTPYRVAVAVLLGLALGAFVVATLRALRAASGVPGEECLLTGEDLQEWTRREVVEVYRAITLARRLAVTGVCALALAVALTWFAPVAHAPTSAPGRRPVVPVPVGSAVGAARRS